MNGAPKPERKRWKAPALRPQPAPAVAAPEVEDDRVRYARWLVGCGMEKRAAAQQAARRDLVSIKRVLRTLDDLRSARAKAPQ